jgi:hypothetical protein
LRVCVLLGFPQPGLHQYLDSGLKVSFHLGLHTPFRLGYRVPDVQLESSTGNDACLLGSSEDAVDLCFRLSLNGMTCSLHLGSDAIVRGNAQLF